MLPETNEMKPNGAAETRDRRGGGDYSRITCRISPTSGLWEPVVAMVHVLLDRQDEVGFRGEVEDRCSRGRFTCGGNRRE
jgi:hypothetical protein